MAYETVVNGEVVDWGSLRELVNRCDYLLLEMEDDERPYLLYDSEKLRDKDPDGRYAIGMIRKIYEYGDDE